MILKRISVIIISLGLFLSVSVSTVSAQTSFNKFWAKFRSAVNRNDKQSVADLTVFPIRDEAENDEGPNPPYSRKKFLKNYSYFFNRDIKACFAHPTFEKNGPTPNMWVVNCGVLGDPHHMSFLFEKKKVGWRWIAFNTD